MNKELTRRLDALEAKYCNSGKRFIILIARPTSGGKYTVHGLGDAVYTLSELEELCEILILSRRQHDSEVEHV